MKEISKSYCHIAYNHIYASPFGTYALCSKSHTPVSTLLKYKTYEHLPFDVFFSPEMEQIRIDMNQGKIIPECEWCDKIEEANGGQGSERQRWNKEVENPLNGLKYGHITPHSVNFKVRFYGTYCNIECFMCPPSESASRYEFIKRNNIDREYFKLGNNQKQEEIVTNEHFEKVLQNIVDNAQYINWIEFMGGETLQLPRVFKFMEQIPDNLAENIGVFISTNMTKLTYKGKDVNEWFKRFKSVHCKFSIDHYQDEKLKWIRYPINPDDVRRNLDHIKNNYDNWDVYVAPTATILNLEDLDDTVEYWMNGWDLKVNEYMGIACQETHSVRNHPRKHLFNNSKYDQAGLLNGEINKSFDPKYYNRAIEYWDLLDSIRGTNWRKLWDFEPIELIQMEQL